MSDVSFTHFLCSLMFYFIPVSVFSCRWGGGCWLKLLLNLMCSKSEFSLNKVHVCKTTEVASIGLLNWCSRNDWWHLIYCWSGGRWFGQKSVISLNGGTTSTSRRDRWSNGKFIFHGFVASVSVFFYYFVFYIDFWFFSEVQQENVLKNRWDCKKTSVDSFLCLKYFRQQFIFVFFFLIFLSSHFFIFGFIFWINQQNLYKEDFKNLLLFYCSQFSKFSLNRHILFVYLCFLSISGSDMMNL